MEIKIFSGYQNYNKFGMLARTKNVSCANLMPLQKDTVCFRGSELKKSDYMEAFDQLKISGRNYKPGEAVFFEGDIIDKLHQVGFDTQLDGIILNAGAYTHTSLAIADAISAINVPVIEVHISNVHAREEVRHHSMISGVCRGVIAGFGMDSYRLAIESIIK